MSTNRVDVDVGKPSIGFGGWTTTEVYFPGFANLPTTRGESSQVESPQFSCLGHKWIY